MAFKLNDKNKKIVEGSGNNNSAAPVSNQAPVQKPVQKSTASYNPSSTSSTKKTGGFKLNDTNRAIVNAETRTVNAPTRFVFGNNVYTRDDTGNYFKDSYIKKQKESDREKQLETGHETFLTDLGQSLSGGGKSWGASQLSTLATIPLAISGAVNKDNNYSPEAGSALWRMLNASSANTREANELMENSKEGRGFVGSAIMDVGSQAVMNGIDAAIRSIPVIGQALGTASFTSRSFGATAQQKRDEGKGIATQVLSGAISAGIEQFTEGMSRIGGIRSYTGADTGWLDGAYTMLESSVAKKLGPVVAKLSTTMLSEGIEEVMSDILSPLVTGALENVTKDSKLLGDFEAEQWQSVGDIAYDGLIGALSAIGGGMVEATGAINTYRNEANSDNALYSTMLRQQYEADRAEAKRGRALQMGSLFDAVNTLFNKETGESLTERASKAAGTFVRNKDVGKVLAQTDADYVKVVNEVAEKFANQSFANEAVDKDVLKQGVINFFLNGDFSEDLNSIDGAKGQIQKLAQEIMKADAEKRLEQAKGKKDKAKEAYYSSLLSNLVNRSFAEESTNANVDDITEARTYGYSAEELAADQAVREAERQRMESKGVYDNGQDTPIPGEERPFEGTPAPARTGNTSMTQAEYEAMPVEDKAKWLLDSGNTTIRIEGGNKISTSNRQLFNAIAEEAQTRGFSAELVYNEQGNQMEARLTPVEQTAEAEADTKAETDNAQETSFSKADQKKLDKIFTKLGTSIRIKADETALRDAVYARAEAENVDVIEGKYGDRISLSIREKATGNPIIDNQREAKANKNAAEEESVEKLTPEQAEAEAEEQTSNGHAEIRSQNVKDYVVSRLSGGHMHQSIDNLNDSAAEHFDFDVNLADVVEAKYKESVRVGNNKITIAFAKNENRQNKNFINDVVSTLKELAKADGKTGSLRNEYGDLVFVLKENQKGEYNGRQAEQTIRSDETGESAAAATVDGRRDDLSRIRRSNGQTVSLQEGSWNSAKGGYSDSSAARKDLINNNRLLFTDGKRFDGHCQLQGKVLDFDDSRAKKVYEQTRLLCGPNCDVIIIDGELNVFNVFGKYETTYTGVRIELPNNKSLCVVSVNDPYTRIHEPAHVLLADLIQGGKWDVVESIVTHAFTPSEYNRIYKRLKKIYKKADASALTAEMFAFSADGEPELFSTKQHKHFYEALRNSGDKRCVDFANAAIEIINSEYEENRRLITVASSDTSRLKAQSEKIAALHKQLGDENKTKLAKETNQSHQGRATSIASATKFESRIDSFRDDNFFLSNMYRTPVTVDGVTYPSAENAFQALKCADPEDRKKFVNISPFEAKKLGKTVKLVDNWEYKNIDIMRKVLRAKFSNSRLYEKLKATTGNELVEGNTWGDDYWGDSGKNNPNRPAQNNLGKLLMDLRDGTNNAKSTADLVKRALNNDLESLDRSQFDRVLNYIAKRAGINRYSGDVLNEISDYILGNFEKDFTGTSNFKTGANKDSFSSVDAGYSFGNTEVKHSYLHRPLDNGKISRRAIEVRDDAYNNPVEEAPLEINDIAKALLNVIDAMDKRDIDINDAVANYRNSDSSGNYGEEMEIELDSKDFARGGVFSDLNEDYVRSVIESLREGASEGFQTEEAVNLRSSMMSGFSPSAEYSVSDMTVAQRRKLLELAFPNEEFGISPTNPNIITDSRETTELKEYERGERRWNREHLRNGSEADDNQTAFGYVVNSPKTTDLKGREISGWVDNGENGKENISVKDKLAALKKIEAAEQARRENAGLMSDTAYAYAARKGDAVPDKRLSNISQRSNDSYGPESIKGQIIKTLKDLQYYFDSGIAGNKIKLKAVRDSIDRVSNFIDNSSNISETTGSAADRLESLYEVASDIEDSMRNALPYDAKIADKIINLANNLSTLAKRFTRNEEIIREANFRETQRAALRRTWIDILPEHELRKLFFDSVKGNQYYNNRMLTSEERQYARQLYEKLYSEHDNRPVGSDDLAAPSPQDMTMSPEEIKLAKQYNRRNTPNVSGRQTISDSIPTLNEFRAERGDNKRQNLYEQREEQTIADAEAERLAMDDAEYWERRRADKDVVTQQDFERGEDQPVAPKKASPAEANEIAERSFGKKGRVRATRVVENFRKRLSAEVNTLTDAQKDHVENSMAKLGKALEDINDGYGTVKDLADSYRAWRDDKLLADYYDEDVAARFDKILEDAEAKGWTFEAQDQREFAQAYEEACNAMTARINNVNRDADRTSRLAAEAVANKLNIKSDGLVSKAIQRFIRMQITTDTAMKLFGGFKGSGEFYQLGKDIKDAVSKRMVKYVDAYSYFDAVKKMDGFKEFSQNTKRYRIDPGSQFLAERNPLKGHEFTIQQIVTMDRLFKTLNDTFKKSDVTASDRIKGFVIRDADGKSVTINLTDGGLESSYEITAVENACMRFLSQEGAVFEAARAYSEACDKMFKMLGKDVSAVKKAITGNGLSLIGDNYTPVLWANEDGTPADFNFNDDDRIRPPAFLYKRTGKEGHLVISDISYIVDKYIEKAADYVGTAQIKDTLARLNNGTALANKGKGLNSALAENFGKDAGVWFDEYVKDLTEYGENDSIWAALRRNMQKGALIGSPSVMMKQTSSYWSAMGLLSPEALTMAYRWKVGVKAADNTEYNKLLKYRHISDNIDPTLTEIIKGTNKYGKVSNSRVFQLFTNGISEQDFKTVDNLYTATMIDTYLKNQNKSAEYFTSGEFQNDIDSKFTEVMLRSQPMFDTELRAEYARTDNELVKMTSMFRTQQTQNLNLIATAIGEYNAATGTDKAEKGKVLRNTIAGQASAALSLSLLSAAADAMLHGLKKYRGDGDDDDEEAGDGKIELERILGRIGINTIETGAGTVWFGDSVAKWLIDRMSGGETNEFYGLNMGPITTFKNVLDNLEYVAKSPTASNIKNVATNISQLMGIPLNNAYRYVNSVVMYTADITGNNEHKYDDMLKMWGNNAKVSEKNMSGRNRLVESGMTKKEANALVKIIDEDGSGLSKDELQEYYIAHPEDADKVSILWNSMGWKTSFEKTKPNLDKKVVYRSNPLYALMDTDESESVSKSEFTDYALEHQDQMDELSAMYKEQGYKGSLKSAMRSAEQTQLKETAEDAFYENNYNVLFDTVSQMKNGKTWLNNLIRDEYDEYDGQSNPIIRYMIDAKRSAKEVDAAVEEYGATKFVSQYKALRASGLAPSVAITKLDNFDANANGSITQAELAEYYKAHKDEETMIAEFWKACGWSTTWSKYKKSKKLK